MKISLLSFGIAKDITGQRFLEVDLPSSASVAALRAMLVQRFPRLSSLATVRLAVNGEYVSEDLALKDNDEVAIIPPVSGG
ncbi:MAG: molybdopterin converting factor subunit 1 [Saprospiraceae bacterium]|nr:molybdopterin converting factor subunit 1 [Saprospiraceae bacterium]